MEIETFIVMLIGFIIVFLLFILGISNVMLNSVTNMSADIAAPTATDNAVIGFAYMIPMFIFFAIIVGIIMFVRAYWRREI